MDKKEKYRELCALEPDIPIFSQDWWLDAVCGEDGWDVSLVEKKGQVIGALPFRRSRVYSFKTIRTPKMTQQVKLWIRNRNSNKPEKRFSYEDRLVTEIIDQLPPFDYFLLTFYHSLTNWLPFYWRGFKQSTCYTFVLDDLTDVEGIFRRFSHAKRKDFMKAERKLVLGPEFSPCELYDHHAMTLGKQRDKVNYSYQTLARIHEATDARGFGKVFTAIDEQERTHAAIFVVWDPVQAYFLISSIDPEFRSSGAATYLIFKAIMHVSTRTKSFDFEGSMIEGVGNSFRQFGGTQRPYFAIRKTTSKALLFQQFFRDCCRRR